MKLIPWLLALLAGAATALQVVVNGQARSRLELAHPLQAALVNFGVGTVGLVILCLAAGFPWPSAAVMARAPWWVWTGGLLGILYVTAAVLLGPTLGVTLFLTLVVLGQLVGSLLLDETGFLGTRVIPANTGRVLGMVLVLAGVILVALSTKPVEQAAPTTAPAHGADDVPKD